MKTIKAWAMMLVILVGSTSVANAVSYTVKKGDNPSTVARKLNISAKQVMQLAGISNAKKLQIGTIVDTNKLQAAAKPDTILVTGSFERVSQVAASAPVEETVQKVTEEVVKFNNNTSSSIVASKVTEENLKSAKEQQATASLAPVPPRSVISIEPKKDETLGFFEANASLGAWYSDQGANGVYSFLEGVKWSGNKTIGGSLGFGPTLGLDHGWGKNDSSWGYINPGIQLGLWKDLSKISEDTYFLIKPRIGYRWNEDEKWVTKKPASGLTLGVYTDISKAFSSRDMGIIALDANIFKQDSYGALRAYWEHAVNLDWRVKAGVGPVVHVQDKTSWGISPVVSASYRKTWELAIIGDTTGSVGLNLAYYFDSQRRDALKLRAVK